MCLAFLPPSISAQHLQIHVDTLTGKQPFVLERFVIPGTVTVLVNNAEVDSARYRFDPQFRHLWVPSAALGDTAVVRYRVWDLALPDRYTRVSALPPLADSTVISQSSESGTALPQPIQLRRSGSITRGVLAGNNRNATIESGLRLQMSGQLAPDIHLTAMLTDENTPILSEGTTQRLSELDRVFIKMDTPYGSAQLGDFQLRFDQSTFARLDRKIQGIGVSAPFPSGGPSGDLRVAAATSRGLFRTQDIRVKDGVQGPYRLQGNANEPFILVIPGSESVYLNGNRLQRGESHDYVIDYATGELRFTANRLIKYHHRIVVEFQYRTTEFTRTLAAAEVAVSTPKRGAGPPLASLGVTFIREADGKSFDQEFGLTDADKELLANLGDRDASRSGATPVSYDPDAQWTHYTLRDTTIAGRSYSVYLPVTTSMEREVFRVEFTRLGAGRGDYVRRGQSTNGIVYRYRGPGQGEYMPVRVLPKPAQQRMVDVRGSFSPVRHVEIIGEWAHSFRDENRFSSLDAADNLAHSYHTQLRISDLPTGLGKAALTFNRRHTGQNFAAFDRTQPVEFVRSWNLPTDRRLVQVHQETIDEATAAWNFTDQSSITGTLGRLEQRGVFRGNRKEVTLTVDEARIPTLTYFFIHINSNADSVQGKWIRHNARASQALIPERLTINTRLKTSQRHQSIRQGLRQDSQQYWEISPQVEFESSWGTVSAQFDWREQHLWTADYSLIPGKNTATASINYTTKRKSSFQSQGRVGLRYTSHAEFFHTVQGLSDERSLVIRWNGRVQPWNRLVRLNWFYEALSEQTPVLQEIYIRTGPELGEYVWKDSNSNGIAEIDEFVPEVTQDEGNYARTLIPSDSLQSVTGLKARLHVQFDGGQHWRTPKTGWQKWLRQVTLRTAMEVQEKSRDPDPANIYLLRQQWFRHPENSIRGTLSLTQDLWLFRNHPRYGFHASWRRIRSANVLAADTERRSIDEFRAQIRWSLGDIWAFTSEGSLSEKIRESTSFASREFDIQTRSIIQEVQASVTPSLRISAGLDYSRKDASTRGTATALKLPLQSSLERAGRASVTGRMEFARIALSEEENSTGLALFELTDGRGAGRSFLWQMNGWLQLTSVLRATVTYSGRQPENAPPVHTVRMQLSATF